MSKITIDTTERLETVVSTRKEKVLEAIWELVAKYPFKYPPTVRADMIREADQLKYAVDHGEDVSAVSAPILRSLNSIMSQDLTQIATGVLSMVDQEGVAFGAFVVKQVEDLADAEITTGGD